MKRKASVPSPETRKAWLEHVAARKASGESRAAYCRKHGLLYHQLRDWECRNGSAAKTSMADKRSPFVRVERTPASPAGGVRLTLPGGVGLELAEGFDAAQVARLVAAIGGGR